MKNTLIEKNLDTQVVFVNRPKKYITESLDTYTYTLHDMYKSYASRNRIVTRI